MRFALVYGNALTRKQLEAYLPADYKVLWIDEESDSPNRVAAIIGGTDYAGWTMDDYVLPRLASGLIFGRELVEAVPV